MKCEFDIGDEVRYKPGKGTYGYEHLLEADGRVSAKVVGHTNTRVVIEIHKAIGGGNRINSRRVVDASSLEPLYPTR